MVFNQKALHNPSQARQGIEIKKCWGYSPFKLLIFFLSGLHYTSNCYAELRDPTRPAFYSARTESDYNQTDDLNLSSIWISGRNRRATINGVTAKQGKYSLILKLYKSSMIL